LAQYAGERITVWLDPFSDPLNAGFQTVQSLYAIGSGGLLGAGIGASRQKYLYLPEPHNDFIFAIVSEELGFVGALIIIFLFILLIWRGIYIAAHCPERFGSLVAAGLIFQVGLQAILNIAVVTNTVPNTGISLPFFSYGGTSLLMLLCEMGVILSISRVTTAENGEKTS
jgi:cell division protein FtsW